MPDRIQLSRARGWRKPEGAVVVTRGTPWGNPFTVAGAIEHEFASTQEQARKVAVEFFRSWLLGLDPGENDTYRVGARMYDRRWVREHIGELKGRTLACWCPLGGWCHADVLEELANGVRADA